MGIERLKMAAIVIGAVAIVDLVAMAVLIGIKNANLYASTNPNCTANPTGGGCGLNSSIDKFVAGLAIFGTLITLPVLGMIGKILIDFFRK